MCVTENVTLAEMYGLILSARLMNFFESWNMEHEVHEEMHFEQDEFGGIDSGNEVFQVFANPFETKVGECGEESARWWRQVYSVGAR